MAKPSIPVHVIAPLLSTPPGWSPLCGKIEITHVTPHAVGTAYGATLCDLSRHATSEEMREVGFQIDNIVARYTRASSPSNMQGAAPAGDAR